MIENVLIPKDALVEAVNATMQTQLKTELAKQGIKNISIISIEWEAEGLRLYFSMGKQ